MIIFSALRKDWSLLVLSNDKVWTIEKVFAPFMKWITLQLMLSLIATWELHLEQMNMKTTFLHGELKEEI